MGQHNRIGNDKCNVMIIISKPYYRILRMDLLGETE